MNQTATSGNVGLLSGGSLADRADRIRARPFKTDIRGAAQPLSRHARTGFTAADPPRNRAGCSARKAGGSSNARPFSGVKVKGVPHAKKLSRQLDSVLNGVAPAADTALVSSYSHSAPHLQVWVPARSWRLAAAPVADVVRQAGASPVSGPECRGRHNGLVTRADRTRRAVCARDIRNNSHDLLHYCTESDRQSFIGPVDQASHP
jgi:hypothetical protein